MHVGHRKPNTHSNFSTFNDENVFTTPNTQNAHTDTRARRPHCFYHEIIHEFLFDMFATSQNSPV